MNYLTVEGQYFCAGSARNDEGSENIEDLEVDNSKSVLHKIATLYADQLMSDLTLEVGGSTYSAHRLILCASSEVFQVMLMSREWSEWRESRISLQETPSAAAVFPHFLKYFYTGQIKISHQTVLPVLSLADKYNVKDLVTLCLTYMYQHIAQAAKRGYLISWMQYNLACGHDEVAKACQNFVKWNVEWVWSEAELGLLDADTLLHLLQQSDLVLYNEMSLYCFVERWLNKQREKLNSSDLNETEKKMHWDSLVSAVFSHVRFPMMCPNQLAKLLLCPLTQEHREFFMERMAIAMSYQSGQYERVSEVQQTETGRMLFTPRLYTEDIWGSVLAVDNFHSLPCYHTRTFIFSTRDSMRDVSQDRSLEWTLDLYPKGVWFRKSMLIGRQGTYDIPEVVLRTVRISITCQNCPENMPDEYGDVWPEADDVRVKIGILVWGIQNGVEHVSSVVERVHRFSAQDRAQASLNPFWSDDDKCVIEQPEVPEAGPSGNKKASDKKVNTSTDKKKTKRTYKKKEKAPSTLPLASALGSSGSEGDESTPAPTSHKKRRTVESEDEHIIIPREPVRAAVLRSFLNRRTATGYTSQSDPARKGDYYVELRIYSSREIERLASTERWKHSVLTLKLATDLNTPVWSSLTRVVQAAKDEFKHVQPILYAANPF